MKFPEQFRLDAPSWSKYHTKLGDHFGAFVIPGLKSPGRRTLRVIAADGKETGFDHVSVSIDNAIKQIPTWDEMCFVKCLFWDDEEVVMQIHPARSMYVNFHPGVLHLWKPTTEKIPLPPLCLV